MAKKLEDMTRTELLGLYEARGGKLEDFDKTYVYRKDLLAALEELDEVLEGSASFEGPFEFVDDEADDEVVAEEGTEPAHSDQWYIGRGLQVPSK